MSPDTLAMNHTYRYHRLSHLSTSYSPLPYLMLRYMQIPFRKALANALALSISLVCFQTEPTLAQTSGKPYFQQKVDYKIDVVLDDILHGLDGYEKLRYTNRSPDTLRYIWFHLWPNAYKDETTAFGEQLLRNHRKDFYISKPEQKGLINKLAFKVDGAKALLEAHPKHTDIAKLLLPLPLPPGESIEIATPFHVKLPDNFSRSGHVAQEYFACQWYPKPAVYDKNGWHPMPYLDQGEFYSEFGDFEVSITVPDNYLVAASGELLTLSEKEKLAALAKLPLEKQPNYLLYRERLDNQPSHAPAKRALAPKSSATNKTLSYHIANAHDFAWFASKQYLVMQDQLALKDRGITTTVFLEPWNREDWGKTLQYAKRGIRFYDSLVGPYPYDMATVVCGPVAIGSGGMEYPSITLISTQSGEKELDVTIAHELGHNWFYGALGSNERDHAWMDEGMNSYYDNRYKAAYYPKSNSKTNPFEDNLEGGLLDNLEKIGKDPIIDTPSDSFQMVDYGLIVYLKGARWMRELETLMGKADFERGMKAYYAAWRGKHPGPEDFKETMSRYTAKDITAHFAKLNQTAKQQGKPVSLAHRPFSLAFGAPLNKDMRQHRNISLLPMIGFNDYDKFMPGIGIHNYQLPDPAINFAAAALWGTGSGQLNGYARVSYRKFFYGGWIDNVNLSTSFSSFTYQKLNFQDSLFPASYNQRFYRLDPTIRVHFKTTSPDNTVFAQAKYFEIGEQGYKTQTFQYGQNYFYKSRSVWTRRGFGQLLVRKEVARALYPYRLELCLEGNDEFARAGATANYFFNYSKDNGINLRLFAGKFVHLNGDIYSNDRYFLTLTGPRGNQDYAYSNYYSGRSDYDGINSQQVMERDGFFKVGTDKYQQRPGLTDKWLTSMNLTGDIPKAYNPLSILPIKIPLKLFFDIGTYAEAWEETNTSSRFLYDGGVQVSLFGGIANLYLPLVYSKVYKDYFGTVDTDKGFGKKLSFSIDIQKVRLSKLVQGVAL